MRLNEIEKLTDAELAVLAVKMGAYLVAPQFVAGVREAIGELRLKGRMDDPLGAFPGEKLGRAWVRGNL